jgi:hypothetical protein
MDFQKLTPAVALTGSLPCKPRGLERGASQFLIIWNLMIKTDYSVTGDGDSNVCDPIRQGALWNVILAITVLNGYFRGLVN